MTERPIVSILGNSVPILIQPFRTNEHEKTYAEHLKGAGFEVKNASKQSAIISDVYSYLEDECIRHFPDFVILNFGIVECTYRARPRWLQNYFSMNAWNNSVIDAPYNGPILRGIKFILKKVYARTIERACYTIGLKKRWVTPSNFRFIVRDITKRIFQDTPARKVIYIGMTPIAKWVEKKAPGSQASVSEYNAILQSVASEYSNIIYLDPNLLGENIASPDGIHFNARGHQLLAEKLQTLLTGQRDQYTEWQQINQYEKLYQTYAHWFKR